jgi:hypothetical protein
VVESPNPTPRQHPDALYMADSIDAGGVSQSWRRRSDVSCEVLPHSWNVFPLTARSIQLAPGRSRRYPID